MTSECSLCQELNKSAENQHELIEEALSEHAPSSAKEKLEEVRSLRQPPTTDKGMN